MARRGGDTNKQGDKTYTLEEEKKRARMKETVKDGNEREREREREVPFCLFKEIYIRPWKTRLYRWMVQFFFFSRTHRRDFVGSFGFFSLSILPFWTKEQKIKRERRREETEK